MALKQIQKSYPLTTTWQQIEPKDALRIGMIVQNQSTNGDNFLISEGRPTSDFAALEIVIGSELYEDILPAQGEIWAKAVAGTPTMTLALKYGV
jgi:hypothetical protein